MSPTGAASKMAESEGKVALVTGASSGIGRGLALALAQSGWRVVAAARRLPNLRGLREEIEASGGEGAGAKVALVRLDVSADEAAIDAGVEEAWNAFGGIDALINNAGIRGSVAGPLDLEEGEWNRVHDTNLKGVWLMTKAVGKRMRSAGRGGSVINITSIAGLDTSLLPGGLAYGSSKSAANHITKNMALEMGMYGIRVNAIASGMFKTEITDKLFEQEWLESVAGRIVPMQRWGVIDPDLTALILLLCSDASSYITGNVFVVDGGQSLPSVPIWSSL